jgi:hypothetical protein
VCETTPPAPLPPPSSLPPPLSPSLPTPHLYQNLHPVLYSLIHLICVDRFNKVRIFPKKNQICLRDAPVSKKSGLGVVICRSNIGLRFRAYRNYRKRWTVGMDRHLLAGSTSLDLQNNDKTFHDYTSIMATSNGIIFILALISLFVLIRQINSHFLVAQST